MKAPVLALIVVACLAIGFFAGRATAPEPETEAADNPYVTGDDPSATGGSGPELSSPKAEIDRLERELALRKDEVSVRDQEIAGLKQRVGELEAGAPADKRPRYVYEGTVDALGVVDWAAAGETINRLNPLIRGFVEATEEGKEMPADLSEFHRYRGNLVSDALKLQKAGLSGTGVNGALTHPSTQVNLIYAALREAGLPLDETQQAKLDEIGKAFVEEETQRMLRYDESTLQLEKIYEEAALKDRFYASVDGMLSAAQRDALHPDHLRGRLGVDLFSSGLVWIQISRVSQFATREEIAPKYTQGVAGWWKANEAEREIIADAAASWADGFSAEYMAEAEDALYLQRKWIPVARVREAAKRQLEFLRQLQQRLPTDSALRQRVMSETAVLVPYIKAP